MPTYALTSIRVQAFRMARTGEFTDWRSIEAALERREGRRARLALGQHAIREHLDALCNALAPSRGEDRHHPGASL